MGVPLEFIRSFDPVSFLDTFASLGFAFVLGTLIGAERQYRQRTAGLRTNVLVALSAAAFVDVALHINGTDGAARVISYVVSGIGFLGAGVIMKEGLNVRGLNTAATLWASAAVGACAGVDMAAEAVLITFFVIAGNTLLRPLAAAIDRIPLNTRATEAEYEIRVATTPAAVSTVRKAALSRLAAASFPVADADVEAIGDGRVEIVATLVNTSVDRAKLEKAVAEIGRLAGVESATWETSSSS
jgi:putative Mg2+ transporter-C (MgtC) family protein